MMIKQSSAMPNDSANSAFFFVFIIVGKISKDNPIRSEYILDNFVGGDWEGTALILFWWREKTPEWGVPSETKSAKIENRPKSKKICRFGEGDP